MVVEVNQQNSPGPSFTKGIVMFTGLVHPLPPPVTVMVLVAVYPPSAVLTVITELPAETPVTSPDVLTVAAPVFDDVQVTLLFVAFEGNTVAVSCWVFPLTILAEAGVTLTPVTGTVVVVTVIVLVAVKPPSAVRTVITDDPVARPVTRPAVLTVATDVLPDVHVTDLLVALAGATVAVSCRVPSTAIDALVGVTLTPVTGTLEDVTVMVLVAVKPPSAVRTVITDDPAARPVTRPAVLTVATDVLPDVHVTDLLVALAGATVAVS